MNFREYLRANPALSAPMSGYSETVQRRIQRAFGAGIVFTWLISARALLNPRSRKPLSFKFYEEEHPIGVQLVGENPRDFGEASKICEEAGFDFININAGCPDRNIIKKGAGGALLGNTYAIAKIIENIRLKTNLPITLKIRAGITSSNPVYLEIGRLAEELDVSMLIIHPRSVEQGKRGTANWNVIKELKGSVSIPVVGNGDIKKDSDALAMQKQTGCDGVMIGRGAISAPWIFARANSALRNEPALPLSKIISEALKRLAPDFQPAAESTVSLIAELALLHLGMLKEEYGKKANYFAIKEVPFYCSGFPGSADIRYRLFQTNGAFESMVEIFTRLKNEAELGKWIITES